MYYIETDIEFQAGIKVESYGFHYISRYTVDFINKKTEIEISSSKSKQDWLDRKYFSPHVNFYELGDVPAFNEDPAHFILKKLVTIPSTVFYGKKVQKDYNLVKLEH